MGIWAPVDSRVVSSGGKGSSGTEWKDSVRSGILRVIDVNLVLK